MAKYYVKSGTLEVVVSCPDFFEAAVAGLRKSSKSDVLGEFFYVDERGFRGYEVGVFALPTGDVARAAGWRLSR